MIIVLIGYMGSGKSSVGIELANQREVDFVDLDTYIEKKEKTSIRDLVKKNHVQFRINEGVYLQKLLKSDESFVFSLGGGTPIYGDNLAKLKKSKRTTSIYLKTKVQELSNRLFDQRYSRPIIHKDITSKKELSEFISKHLLERAPFYEQADSVVETDGKSIIQLVSEINKILL